MRVSIAMAAYNGAKFRSGRAISVAMCTFNGERHIGDQLRSLQQQTCQPSELVITDDGSTDQTEAIIREFAASAVFPVRFYRNERRLGYSANFLHALSLCRGDVIFLSDQDDIWEARKLEVFMEVFDSTPDTLAILHDCRIWGEDGAVAPSYVQQLGRIGVTSDGHILGWCTAIRQEVVELIAGVNTDVISHDRAIHDLTLALGRRTFVPEVLGIWRRHGATATNYIAARGKAISPLSKFRWGMRSNRVKRYKIAYRMNCEVLHLLEEVAGNPRYRCASLTAAIKSLKLKNQALARRISVTSAGLVNRFFAATRLLRSGDYHLYFKGWRSYLKDVALRG